MDRQLVVAYYKENLLWLNKIQFPYIVYDKSSNVWANEANLPNFALARNKLGEEVNNRIPLANLGREAHSYIFHIVNNYDQLADVTVFCQGNPFTHCGNFIELAHSDVQGWKPCGPILQCTNTGLPHHNLGWLSKFHKILFECDPPNEYFFVREANFAVTRERIKLRSLDFWNKAFDLSINYCERSHLGTDGSPWIFERLWRSMFTLRS